jgi:hypothetical protein
MEFEILKEDYTGIQHKIDELEKLCIRIEAGIKKSSGEVVPIGNKTSH